MRIKTADVYKTSLYKPNVIYNEAISQNTFKWGPKF